MYTIQQECAIEPSSHNVSKLYDLKIDTRDQHNHAPFDLFKNPYPDIDLNPAYTRFPLGYLKFCFLLFQKQLFTVRPSLSIDDGPLSILLKFW
jgi:hypothetical protein